MHLRLSNLNFSKLGQLFNQVLTSPLPFLIGAGIIMFSGVIAFKVTPRLLEFVTFGVLALMVALLYFRAVHMILVLLILGAMFSEFAITTGTESDLNIALLISAVLTGMWLLQKIVLDQKFDVAAKHVMLPLLGLSIGALLSFQAGIIPVWNVRSASIGAQMGGLFVVLFSVGVFVLVADRIRDPRHLRMLVWVYLITGAGHVLFRLIRLPDEAIINIYLSGAFGSVFWIWTVALSLSQAVFNHELSNRVRSLLAILAAGTLYVGVIMTQSWISGWLPAVIAGLVVLFFAIPPKRRIYVVILSPLVLLLVRQLSGQLVTATDNDYSLFTRVEAWRTLFQVVMINPVLGLGPANYFWYTHLFPILGYYVSFNSHNQYMDILAQFGVVGLIFLLGYFWQLGKLGLSLLERVEAGFPRAYLIGALAGLVGMLAAGMLGDWFLPFIYNIGLDGFRASIFGWVFLGGIVSLTYTAKPVV